MKDTQSAEPPGLSFSSGALDEWNRHVDAILRGIAHAFNNRAAALSAAIQLGRDPSEAPGVVRSILEPELSRVTELAASIRALGAPKGGDEAFSPRDAAAEASAILGLHAEQRERGVTIDATAASPLRTHRWMFVRALVALGASTSGAPVTVRDDGDAILVVADGAAQSSAYARELAIAMGGMPLSGPRAGFRIPTLAAIRQREGR
jgi:hypothetical protein